MLKPTSVSGVQSSPQAAPHQLLPQTVTCTVCNAVYAPSPAYQRLQYAPYNIVESIFMSTCHFCFRCRRAACPQCWDAVHGVCGACVEEVRLPFRQELPPLDGVMFPPNTPLPPDQRNVTTSQLLCIRPGRFQQSNNTPTTFGMISHPGETNERGPNKRPLKETPLPLNIENLPLPFAIPRQKNEESVPLKRDTGILKMVERVLILLTLVILLVLLLLILLAELSATANAQIAQFFHVDIRTEIAYVLHHLIY
jgi:hypothetical protein